MAYKLSAENGGAIPATIPSGSLIWPLPAIARVVPTSGGKCFGRDRRPRNPDGTPKVPPTGRNHHIGVDLIAPAGSPILATEAGVIKAFWPFVKPYVYALSLETATQVLCFGEVSIESLQKAGMKCPSIQGTQWSGLTNATYPKKESEICGPGSQVQAGQVIAYVGMMRRDHMLHFEIYAKGKITHGMDSWPLETSPPGWLRDPTPYLLACAGQATAQDNADQLARARLEKSAVNSRSRDC